MNSRSVISKGHGDLRGLERVVDMEAYTVCSIKIISHRLYFLARGLSFSIGNVFGSQNICLFSFYPRNAPFGYCYCTNIFLSHVFVSWYIERLFSSLVALKESQINSNN